MATPSVKVGCHPLRFDAYIVERFDRYEQAHGKSPYSRKQTLHYLQYLAQQLKARNQTAFLIEQMQPAWLETRFQRWQYRLILGLRSDIATRTQPNQGILASFRNSVVVTVFGLILAGLLYLGLNWLLPLLQLDADAVDSIVAGVSAYAIWISLIASGGLACMEHLALRLVLWLSGAIPRDYADFLRYTSELRLTRQTGGEFRFFHDLLREHIAQSPLP